MRLRLAQFSALVLFSLSASATTIDFESFSGTVVSNWTFTVDGYRFNGNGDGTVPTLQIYSYSANSSAYPQPVGDNALYATASSNYDSAWVSILPTDSEPFSFISFVTRSTDSFTVHGNLNRGPGGSAYTAVSMSTSQLASEDLGNNLTRYFLTEEYYDLDWIRIIGDSGNDTILLDELVFGAAVVPLPPAAFLFVSALAWLRVRAYCIPSTSG